MNLSNQIEIPIKCPKCRKTIKKRLSDIHGIKKITCTCGHQIEIIADQRKLDPLRKEIANIDDALKKLGK